MTKDKMGEEELLALPVTVDLSTAGRAFGLGRTKAYEMARADEFPCPVLSLGRRLVVTKAALLKALGMEWAPERPAQHPDQPAA
jgi:hypothetical protein